MIGAAIRTSSNVVRGSRAPAPTAGHRPGPYRHVRQLEPCPCASRRDPRGRPRGGVPRGRLDVGRRDTPLHRAELLAAPAGLHRRFAGLRRRRGPEGDRPGLAQVLHARGELPALHRHRFVSRVLLGHAVPRSRRARSAVRSRHRARHRRAPLGGGRGRGHLDAAVPGGAVECRRDDHRRSVSLRR